MVKWVRGRILRGRWSSYMTLVLCVWILEVELIVLRVLDGLPVIVNSGLSGCLRIYPRHLILSSEILMEGGTSDRESGSARERRYALEHEAQKG